MLIVLTILALAALAMLAKIYLDDTGLRALDAEHQRQASEQTNRENQDAILRLMNELGDLADGDLTVTATVSENITGAIADSINYTIEELSVLVGSAAGATRVMKPKAALKSLNSKIRVIAVPARVLVQPGSFSSAAISASAFNLSATALVLPIFPDFSRSPWPARPASSGAPKTSKPGADVPIWR